MGTPLALLTPLSTTIVTTAIAASVPSGCTRLGGNAGIEVPKHEPETTGDDGDYQDSSGHLRDTEGPGNRIDETAGGQPLEREEGSKTAGKTLEPAGRGNALEGIPKTGKGTGNIRKLEDSTSTSHSITMEKGDESPRMV